MPSLRMQCEAPQGDGYDFRQDAERLEPNCDHLRWPTQAGANVLWFVVAIVCFGLCSCARENDTHLPATEPVAQESTATSTTAATTAPSAPNASASLDLDAVIASIPEDTSMLRQRLQREWEISFTWHERNEAKVMVAQFSFQPQLKNSDLIALAGLEGPLALMLNNTPIGDDSLALLARLRTTQRGGKPLLSEVWELYLGYTKVSDAGLRHLSVLESLRVLDLTRLDITDAGLTHLSNHKHLRRLVLARTKVRGAGLVHLRALSSLEHLDLDATPLDDAGLYQLPALPQLRSIVLRGTRITDNGLVRLKEFRALEHLDITHTQITDACVSYLKELKKLQRLRIADNRGLTERGAIQLRLALPETVQID